MCCCCFGFSLDLLLVFMCCFLFLLLVWLVGWFLLNGVGCVLSCLCGVSCIFFGRRFLWCCLVWVWLVVLLWFFSLVLIGRG